jgi:hypothetical protein
VRALIAALTLCLTAAAATAAEPVFPPGSRIGLTPPKNMEISKRFTGFENPGKASITLVEMPPEAYPKLAAGFSKEVLEKQGVTVKAHEQLKVAGQPALFIAGEQTGDVKLRRWILAVNEKSVTAMIVAQSVGSEQGYGDKEMRAALTSVALRAPRPIEEQLAPLPFRLGNRAGFRPVRVLSGNALLLTEGPQDVIKDVEQPFLVISSAAGPVPPTEETRERLAKAALGSNQTLKDFAIERSQGFRLGGTDWHEIVARAKDASSNAPVVVMQTIRFAPGTTLRMIGVAREEKRDALLPRFRAVIDAVTVKEP